jgi:two-component system chemotaxis response regulator CheY
MEVLNGKNHREFMAFLPEIRANLNEWQLVDIKLISEATEEMNINTVAKLIFDRFRQYEGRIYVGDTELLMLVRVGRAMNSIAISQEIEDVLPPKTCIVEVDNVTAESLQKLAMRITYKKQRSGHADLHQTRVIRTENVVLIADDDMYMRMLIKKALGARFTVHEVIHGGEIMAAYKKYVPDIVLLDIHMPGKDGRESLENLLTLDIEAYVVMLSSDSSPENVIWSTKHGAKGFLAKPFNKDKLMEYLGKCPTIR